MLVDEPTGTVIKNTTPRNKHSGAIQMPLNREPRTVPITHDPSKNPTIIKKVGGPAQSCLEVTR